MASSTEILNTIFDSARGTAKVTFSDALAGEDTDPSINTQGITFKPVVSSTYSPTTYQYAAGLVTTANVKSTSGNVYSICFTNTNAAARYVQLHDTTTTPAASATAKLWFLVPAGTAAQPGIRIVGMDELAPSEYFTTGIAWAASTTAATYTAATAGDHTITVRYM